MLAVAVAGSGVLMITCTRCGRALPPWRYPTILGDRCRPDEPAQPCKDCRDAETAASLARSALAICEHAHLGSAVMLLVDLLDALADPEEISQAGRTPLASPEGPVGGG